MKEDPDRTASLMTPAKLAQVAGKPKAPVSPAAWLDRMATDAGHAHVKRLAELHVELKRQAAHRDDAPLASALAKLSAALPQLDFGLVQQKAGFLSRLSGKARSAVGEFAAQYDHVDEGIDAVLREARALQGAQAEHAGGADRTLVEFEVEFRAIDKIIDQGARWLQDMRAQLKTREAAAAGDEGALRQVREEAQRCELLVARLKRLRALSSAAHECHQQAQAASARRAALVQKLHGGVAARVHEWRSRICPLANAARNGDVPGLNLEAPMDCHRELQLCIKDATADCAQMQAQDAALAQKLEALGADLQAAA